MKNYVNLLGRAGTDPELRVYDNGTNARAVVSIATSERWKDKEGNKKESTEWHRLVFWGKQAEIAHQYIKKGTLIDIQGKIRTRSYDDKDGKKCFATEIQV